MVLDRQVAALEPIPCTPHACLPSNVRYWEHKRTVRYISGEFQSSRMANNVSSVKNNASSVEDTAALRPVRVTAAHMAHWNGRSIPYTYAAAIASIYLPWWYQCEHRSLMQHGSKYIWSGQGCFYRTEHRFGRCHQCQRSGQHKLHRNKYDKKVWWVLTLTNSSPSRGTPFERYPHWAMITTKHLNYRYVSAACHAYKLICWGWSVGCGRMGKRGESWCIAYLLVSDLFFFVVRVFNPIRSWYRKACVHVITNYHFKSRSYSSS